MNMRRVAFVAVLAALIIAGTMGTALGKDYKIGQTATSSNFKFTVYGIQQPFVSPNQFSKAKPGNHFAIVDVQVTNTQKSQQAFSSLLGFHLLDSLHHQYNESLGIIGLPAPTPEGQIAPKGAIRGFVGFEIPDGALGLKLRVQGGLTASGATFKLT